MTSSALPHVLTLHDDYPATARAVRDIRHAVSGLAQELGAEPEIVSGIALAVTEVCANVVVHAYKEPVVGRIEVHACGDANSLRIVISDTGDGMAPRDNTRSRDRPAAHRPAHRTPGDQSARGRMRHRSTPLVLGASRGESTPRGSAQLTPRAALPIVGRVTRAKRRAKRPVRSGTHRRSSRRRRHTVDERGRRDMSPRSPRLVDQMWLYRPLTTH